MKRLLWLTILGISSMSMAQVDKKDSSEIESFDEVLISAQRYEQTRKEAVRQVEVISSKKLSETQAATLAEALVNSGKVFVQKSQMGGGSPVLRGFEASRVLMVVDGVRMNNSTFRAGHLQDIIAIDQFILDRMEINLGSGSTLYGSDALGGVMYFKTKDVKFGASKWTGSTNLRYLSAFNGVMANAGIQYQSQKFGLIANITHSNYGDLRMGSKSYVDSNPDFGLRNYYVKTLDKPVLLSNGNYRVDTLMKNDDPLKQVGTAYNQTDVFLKLGIRTGKVNQKWLQVLNFQGSFNSNIPRYDRLQQQKVVSSAPYGINQARWDYAPQHRTFLSYTLNQENDKHRNRLIIAHQYFEVGRVTRSFNNSVNNLKERTQLDKVNMLTANYDRLDQWKGWQINSGSEYVFNYVNSEATIKNIVTGEITPGPARYVDSFGNTHSASVFSQASKTLGKFGTKVELGARLTYYSLRGVFTENNYWNMPYPEVTFNQTAPSYNVGLVQPLGKNFLMKASFNQAYRNPNIDDMSKVFESLRGQKVLVPTEKLSPEVSQTADLHFSYKFSQRFFVEFGGFYTVVDNLMSDVFGTFKGSDSLDWDGIKTPVYQIKNVGTGNIYGGFANIQWNILQKLWLNASINETQGFVKYSNPDWNKGNNRLDHIPPMFGQIALRWRENNWFAEMQCVFNGSKPVSEYSISGEDNLQYATPSGNPAWQVYNVRAGISDFHGLNLMISVENLLDLRYRYFASGVSAAGRGIHVTAGYKF